MTAWSECRFLTCSVLPVRVACDLDCAFCFSKSSVSALVSDRQPLEPAPYYAFARERGATRLVITGGGEPLLRPEAVVSLVDIGARFFDEIALFTNGTRLTSALSTRLFDAGLSYVCWSRHHDDDVVNRTIMGEGAPSLDRFFDARPARVRATCVMNTAGIATPADVDRYRARLSAYGVAEFTFKHTYVAYANSVFGESKQNRWVMEHQVQQDPFVGRGTVLSRLPWGPTIRKLDDQVVCWYHEPTPDWELENRLCRSVNLLSDGAIYASLEDESSRLPQL